MSRVVAVVLLAGAGCASSLASQTERDRSALLVRAEADLQCPQHQLQATATEHKRYPGGPFPTRYKVDGCGRSESYVWHGLQDWMTAQEHASYRADAERWPAPLTGPRLPPHAGGVAPRR